MTEKEAISLEMGRVALSLAISRNREEEQELRKQYEAKGIFTAAVDFGGDFLPMTKKIIERAVVAAQRQQIVADNHVGEGAIAGATKAAIEQIAPKALGLSVGGKIGMARSGEHLCVAIFLGIGVLNLNEVAVALAHRSLPYQQNV